MLCSVLIGGLHLNLELLSDGCRCLSICGDFDEGVVENGVGVIQVLGLVVCCFAMVRVSECFDV